jgi:uncharacterized protein (TIGR02217 family)
MSFFECEFPRTISFRPLSGPSASTFVVAVESGNEQRNRNWAGFRNRYTISLITHVGASRQQFVDQLRTFFFMLGGKADAFRFFDHLDYQSTNESLATLSSTTFQLQRTYALGGRTYVRTITKPITSSVIDYTGANLVNTVRVKVAGVLASPQPGVDHATGIVTFAGAPGGAVTADFQYHIPVRLDSDDQQFQVEESDAANQKPIISWNSIPLVEVLPPNY